MMRRIIFNKNPDNKYHRFDVKTTTHEEGHEKILKDCPLIVSLRKISGWRRQQIGKHWNSKEQPAGATTMAGMANIPELKL